MVTRALLILMLSLGTAGCYKSACADVWCFGTDASDSSVNITVDATIPDVNMPDVEIPDAGLPDTGPPDDAVFDGCVREASGMPTGALHFASSIMANARKGLIEGTCGNIFMVASELDLTAYSGELRRIRVMAGTDISSGASIQNEYAWPIRRPYQFISGTYGFFLAENTGPTTRQFSTRDWVGGFMQELDPGPRTDNEAFGRSTNEPLHELLAYETTDATRATIRFGRIEWTSVPRYIDIDHVSWLGTVQRFGPVATLEPGIAITFAFQEGTRAKIGVRLYRVNGPLDIVIHSLEMPTGVDAYAFISELASTINVRPMRDMENFLLTWQASGYGYARRLALNGSMSTDYAPEGTVMDAVELPFGVATISATATNALHPYGTLIATVFDRDTGVAMATAATDLIGPRRGLSDLAATLGGQVVGSATPVTFNGAPAISTNFFIFRWD